MLKIIKKSFSYLLTPIIKLPFIHWTIERLYFLNFPGSAIYWENRYKIGKTSGAGSYGRLAKFKADVLNDFFNQENIGSVIDFGCGDGNQLSLLRPPKYVGFDASKTAIRMCKKKFAMDKNKNFFLYDSLCFVDNNNLFRADLTLSIDVIYHLIEDEVFHEYMVALFSSSERYVIIYSTDFDEDNNYHEKRRKFTKWVESNAPDWELYHKIENKYPHDSKDLINTSEADFYFFRKNEVFV